MKATRGVVLELTRGHQAQVEGAPFDDETEYLLRHGLGAYRSARFPWSTISAEDLLAVSRGTSGAHARDRIGKALGTFLETLGWSTVRAELLQALREEGSQVRVTIRCNASELCRLPFELLPLDEGGEALGMTQGCHVQWEWPSTVTADRELAAPPEGGAFLFGWSTAGGPLDAAEHFRAIDRALKKHKHVPGIERGVERIEDASWERLLSKLEEVRSQKRSVAVLHLLCHGGLLPGPQGGYGLWLGTANGGAELMDPATCARKLKPYAGLVGCVVLCSCDGANLGDSANQLGSVAQRLHRAGFPAVVASRAPLSSTGAKAFSETFHGRLLSGEPFDLAVAAGRGQLGGEWAALQVYARAEDGAHYPVVFRPYRGLQSFEESHRRFFFGREALTGKLQARVTEASRGEKPGFQVVAGSSGSGKSSLVKAGLLPELRKAGWRIAVLRPEGDGAVPLKGLARLARALRDLREAALVPAGSVNEATVLAEARDLRAQWPDAPLLVVVDQLEESFRLEGDEGRSFLQTLWRLAKDQAFKVVVLSTFRSDLLDRAADVVLEGQVTLQSVLYREEHLCYVSRMNLEETLDAIRRPLDAVGLSLQSGLDDSLRDEVGNEVGALPLLEHGLDALWRRREGRMLTKAAYTSLGGLSGALSTQLDLMWDQLPSEQQRQGQRLLVRLADIAEDVSLSTRRRGWVDQLRPEGAAPAAAFEAILDLLVDQRLLVRGQVEGAATTGAGWVEIGHEALIRRWERLQRWLREGRADEELRSELERIADQWSAWRKRKQKDKGESFLPTGRKLEELEELERRAGPLPPELAQCLNAARSKRRAEQWRSRAAWAVIPAAAVSFLAISAAAVVQWRAADRERRSSLSRELTANASANMETGDPQLNLALLRRAGELAQTEQLVPMLARWELLPNRVLLRGHSDVVHAAVFSPDGRRVVTAGADGICGIYDAASGKRLVQLGDGTGTLLKAEFSRDGRRVLTAEYRGDARIWDASSGALIATLDAADLETAAFSPDGLRVVTTGANDTARIWDASSGTSIANLSHPSSEVLAAAFSSDGRRVITAGKDHTVHLWDSSGKRLATLSGKPNGVTTAAFSPDGQCAVTVTGDRLARVWNVSSGKLLATLSGHSADVLAAAFSPDGRLIVTTSQDSTARVWESASGKLLATLSGHSGPVVAATFSPDGLRVATASEDSTARVWEAPSGRLLATLSGHTNGVLTAAFSPDGLRVVTASEDFTARVWDLSAGKAVATLSGHASAVLVAAFSPDSRRALTAGDHSAARIWDAASGTLLTELAGPPGAMFTAAFSPDGRRVFTGGDDRQARLWDASSGKLLVTFSPPPESTPSVQDLMAGHFGWVTWVAFSPDGSRVVTCHDDSVARVWETDSGALLSTLSGHRGLVEMATFSPDGQRVVTTGTDNEARVWRVPSGELLAILAGDYGPVGNNRVDRKAKFSPDGARVLTSSFDNTARLWDSTSGKLLLTLSGHSGWVRMAAFSPDGLRIVTASDDHTARVWDAASGKELLTLGGHSGWVRMAAFSPDGLYIVTVGRDSSARVWDSTSGQLLDILAGHSGPLQTAAFSPDGLRIITAGDDQTARIWRNLVWAPPAYQQALLSSARELTPEERHIYLHDAGAHQAAPPED